MMTKAIHLPEDLNVSSKEYAVNLYKDRKITLREASELADASLREMLDLLMEHGVRGNVTLGQARKSLETVERLLES